MKFLTIAIACLFAGSTVVQDAWPILKHYEQENAQCIAIPFRDISVGNIFFSITSKPGNYFWSNGYGWGNAEVGDQQVKIIVDHGELNLQIVELKNRGVI